MPTATGQDVKERLAAARAAVGLGKTPRPHLAILAIFPELFSPENLYLLQASDGVLIDLEEFSEDNREIENWINQSYALNKQVFAAANPESLAKSDLIRRRGLTAVPRTNEFAGHFGQDLANSVARSIEALFKKVPGTGNPFSVESTRAARSSKSSTHSYKPDSVGMMDTEQEKAFNEFLTKMGQ